MAFFGRSPRLVLSTIPLMLVAGCGHSPATTYLLLDPAPPAPASVRAGYRGLPIVIPAVHMPAEIDRLEYVREVGPGQAKVDDFTRWAAPLGTLARDTLVRDLISRLPDGAVLPPGAIGGSGTRTIDVTILSLGASGGRTSLQAAFRVLPNGPVHQVKLSAPRPGGDQPAQSAQAFGNLLGKLADELVADLPSR